jgi:hypothetical protein
LRSGKPTSFWVVSTANSKFKHKKGEHSPFLIFLVPKI